MVKLHWGLLLLIILPLQAKPQSVLRTYEKDTAYMEEIEVLYGDNQPLKRWVVRTDAPSGYWLIYADKMHKRLVEEGKLLHGKKDSTWVRYDSKGKKSLSIDYRRGFINGQEIYYNTKTGKTLLMYTYKNSIKNGPYVIYHPSGVKWEEGSFRNGVPNGVWKSWDSDGKLLNQRTYADGVLVDEKVF